MVISGLQKLTLLDFPQKVACTVFWADAICAVRFVKTAKFWTGAPRA